MKKIILKATLCVLTLSSLVFYACSKTKTNESPTPSVPVVDYVKLESYLKGAILEVDEYTTKNQTHDPKKIAEVVNQYAIRETGQSVEQYDQLKALHDKYDKYIDPNDESISKGITAFVNDGLLSKVQGSFLYDLDTEMLRTNDVPEALEVLKVFEQKVDRSDKLSDMEKYSLKMMKTTIKVQYELLKNGSARSACTDCMWKKRWSIFGWAGIFLVAGLIACVAASAGIGFPACAALIAASWAGEIIAHCPICI